MFAKHFISIFILYFAIGFTSNEQQHPVTVLQTTGFIYILFLLFTKMNLIFTLITFVLLSISYINSTFIDYYKLKKPKEIKLIEILETIQKILYCLIIILIIIGFFFYAREQYKDHYKNWSIITFLFGVNKCKSIM